ncbi:MAG: YggS family pyridoxal phosphate-dependent enzyme [Actinomycetota bacterium]
MEDSIDPIKEAERLRRNINNLKKEIDTVCKKIGRDSRDIKIIAAAKYASAGQVKSVYDLGIRNFGENRADQLEEKYNAVKGDLLRHFIGHLQSRKIKVVVPLVEFIHSIDNISTLNKVNDEAKKLNKVQRLLAEVNISGEQSKYGMKPEDLHDFIEKSFNFKNINLEGLMTVAPLTENFGYIREIFSRLRILRDKSNNDFKNIRLRELSMGMSNDYRVAIEEGATMIRIGSIIFK